jgi:glycosyltransferase involved in cell wall biosynthesis
MPRLSAGFNSKPLALFLTPEAPYPSIGGGALRAASVLEFLARRYTVDVIVFREPESPDPAHSISPELVRRVHVIELPHHSRRLPAKIARNFSRLVRAIPPLNDRFDGFGKSVSEFLKGCQYELAVLEHFWCASYWGQVSRHSRRVALDLHNIESVLFDGYASVAPWPLRCAFRRFGKASIELEKSWLPRFDLLLVASEEDAKRIRNIAPRDRIHVYPNAIPFVSEPVRQEEDVVVFSGNLEYRPNIIAVRFFRDRVWPVLRQRWPALRWRLVGRNPASVKKYVGGDSRIEITGPVENAIHALARAKVAVVPVLAASGTRVKILEAWAAGCAVVSTRLGAEGLSGMHKEHLLLADEPEAFAAAVSILLESEELRRKLGRAGRARYLQEFAWESAWTKLEQIGI